MSDITDEVTDEQLRLLIERDNPIADIARLLLEKRNTANTDSAIAADRFSLAF